MRKPAPHAIQSSVIDPAAHGEGYMGKANALADKYTCINRGRPFELWAKQTEVCFIKESIIKKCRYDFSESQYLMISKVWSIASLTQKYTLQTKRE